MTLVAEQVTFRNRGAGGFVLPPTDLTVLPGRITALVGPSGRGKTTLAHLMAGLLTPHSGRVTADGIPVGPRRDRGPRRGEGPGPHRYQRRGRRRLQGHTALLDQDPVAAIDPHLTLRQTITLPAFLRGLPADVDALADEVGLDPGLLDRLPSEVSGGQLQRACLARALTQRPRYLIADEATAHLDPISTAAITRALRRRADSGLAILAITHDHRLARAWADEIVVLGS